MNIGRMKFGGADGVWRLPEVLAYTGMSESTIRRRIKYDGFPASERLGGGESRAVGWRAAEVKAWVAGRFRRAA